MSYCSSTFWTMWVFTSVPLWLSSYSVYYLWDISSSSPSFNSHLLTILNYYYYYYYIRLLFPVAWYNLLGFPGGPDGEDSTCNVGDLGSITELGRFSGEGKSYPLQYSGLENSVDCIADGVTKSQTQLSHFHLHKIVPVNCLEKKYLVNKYAIKYSY